MDIKPPVESDPAVQEAIQEALPEIDVRPAEYSDDALALQFSSIHADDLRYVEGWGRWFHWNEHIWVRDSTLHVFGLARRVCRSIAAGCGDTKLAKQISSASTVAAVERFAKSDHRHAATTDQWDQDKWLLNTPAGMVDLRSGQLIPHQRAAYCTKTTAVSPGGECKRWYQFLREVTDGDELLQGFLQRMVGYCLCGSVREHAIFFLLGSGGNGKGVFVSALSGILGTNGGYATTAPMEVFVETNSDRHPAELAKLVGARMVVVSETAQGRNWNETKIKMMTGGDRIPARYLYQNWFDYEPQFKPIIVGNHRPVLRSVDEAMRRRFHLVPFNVTFSQGRRDPELAEKLKAEWPGILQWLIDGCLEWQQIGLNPPDSVRSATEDYLAAEDLLQLWVNEKCNVGAEYATPVGELYDSWGNWCQGEGERLGSKKAFSQSMMAHGFQPGKERHQRIFRGIGLKPISLRGLDTRAKRRVRM